MATVPDRTAALHRTANRRPANDAKFPRAYSVAIIVGSSIVLWTIIAALIIHYR